MCTTTDNSLSEPISEMALNEYDSPIASHVVSGAFMLTPAHE